MSDEYWIGEEIDYASLWNAYQGGADYIKKYQSMRVHLLRIRLTEFPSNQPLFNHEVVFKTIKGYYFDLKKAVLTEEEFQNAGPLFLYSVNRGSGVWKFLGEIRITLLLATTLATGKVLGDKVDPNNPQVQEFLEYFPDRLHPSDFERFSNAKPNKSLTFGINNLLGQEIRNIGVSQLPFEGKIGTTEKSVAYYDHRTFIHGNQFNTEKIGRDKIGAERGGVAIGGEASVKHSDLKQIWGNNLERADFDELGKEIADLRNQMRISASTPRQDITIGHLAEAELAANEKDGPSVLRHLRLAGTWALDFATQAGASLLAAVILQALNT